MDVIPKSCDLLSARRGFKKEAERIPPLQLFLELGASSNTMVQLIGAGFSRHSASIISRNVTNKNLDQDGTRLLVRSLNESLDGLPYSEYVKREIRAHAA